MSIVLQDVSYTYMQNTPYERLALDKVSVQIDKGEFVALIGHSGSGKSTLVQHIKGLINPSTGSVLVEGINIREKNKQAKYVKYKVGLVFQYPEHQLFAETVFEDVAFGPRNIGLDEVEVNERVEKALNLVQLSLEEFGERSPFQLSGGQMRRVAIAGVLAMQPDYLILDEPSAGLDPKTKEAFFAEIKSLYEQTGIAIVLVTHSMEEAVELSNRLLVMSGGRIILDGKPQDIFAQNKEVLRAAGVDVPEIIALKECLNKHGISVSESILHKEELVEYLANMLPKEKI